MANEDHDWTEKGCILVGEGTVQYRSTTLYYGERVKQVVDTPMIQGETSIDLIFSRLL